MFFKLTIIRLVMRKSRHWIGTVTIMSVYYVIIDYTESCIPVLNHKNDGYNCIYLLYIEVHNEIKTPNIIFGIVILVYNFYK